MPVYEKIHAVQAALAKQGIAKDQRNQTQGYQFRGIDDVYEALAPLLAEHKLLIFPLISDRAETHHETSKGNTLLKTVVCASYKFVDVEDGSSEVVTVYGEGADSGDKSTNKAMSTAYKYMAFQTFCVKTGGGDDTENESHELASGSQQQARTTTKVADRPQCPGCGEQRYVYESKDDPAYEYFCWKKPGGCGARW